MVRLVHLRNSPEQIFQVRPIQVHYYLFWVLDYLLMITPAWLLLQYQLL